MSDCVSYYLLQVAKAVSLSLNSCVNCLPGQRDIDNVLKSINSSQEMLSSAKFPPSDGRSYAELQVSVELQQLQIVLS